MVDRFSKHVNPEEARVFKLFDADKRYVRAEGIRLFDDGGEEYLDFTAGYGALSLGHNPTEVLGAVQQAATLPSVLFVGTHPLVGALAENLHKILPGHQDVVSFGSGGAEAVEIALKTARAATSKKRLVYCDSSYHGLSFGSLSIGGVEKYRRCLGPLLPYCENVPFDDLQALEAKLKEGDVAGFIVEPIQGEGGCNVPAEGYLKGVEELCKKHDTLLILDEIQTGFGRTGSMFAAEHEGVEPDIITVGKAFSAGVVPISASATSAEIWNKAYGAEDRFDLMISTFGGIPVACAAALKATEIILRDGLVEHARKMGEYALQRLQDLKARHTNIKEVRGLGLMLGIEFTSRETSMYVLSRMLNKHHIISSYYDHRPEVLRFEPPLNVQKEEVDRAIEAFDEACGKSSVGLAFGAGMTALSRRLRPLK
ncbi:MAG: aspartate aminotransferase family protein [Candidatus Bathyarchaeia archaeon]